ncbi:hypothetical protein MRB53_034579 [Persea americana]|uniref:Uncharacterized protein n=1 Tax=Persea americana TaxID=3435 RepID=A0ACC2K283_PERAE|nr:hypothetical protein MRB53_034579 [Persea americana]
MQQWLQAVQGLACEIAGKLGEEVKKKKKKKVEAVRNSAGKEKWPVAVAGVAGQENEVQWPGVLQKS